MTGTWEPAAPAAAHHFSDGCARLLVEVETQCRRDNCAPGCRVAQAARRVAISAGALTGDLDEDAGVAAAHRLRPAVELEIPL